MIFFIKFFLIFISFSINAREVGQTEITTSGGIEVFKKENYYLLKKDVVIISDRFELKADLVKAIFEKDLYDIVEINSEGNASFISKNGVKGVGENIDLNIKNEDILITGQNSSLINNDIIMKSNKIIKVNNMTGDFMLEGINSRLIGQGVDITGSKIEGIFINIDGINEVQEMFVVDESKVNIKTETLNMFSLSAKYNKKDNIIELFEKVKIIRDNEIITGNYAKINTLTESYKVTSEKSKKVKVLLSEKDE